MVHRMNGRGFLDPDGNVDLPVSHRWPTESPSGYPSFHLPPPLFYYYCFLNNFSFSRGLWRITGGENGRSSVFKFHLVLYQSGKRRAFRLPVMKCKGWSASDGTLDVNVQLERASVSARARTQHQIVFDHRYGGGCVPPFGLRTFRIFPLVPYKSPQNLMYNAFYFFLP